MDNAEKEAIQKTLEEAIENKRQAVNIVVTLSGQLITAALGIIAVEGAYFTFAVDKKDCGVLFLIGTGLAFLGFVGSIICGGKGITKLYKAGAGGDWDYAKGDGWFISQTLSCYIGLILFLISVMAAWKDKPSSSEAAQKQLETVVQGFEKQSVINQQFFFQLQTNQLNSDLRMQLDQLKQEVGQLQKQILELKLASEADKISQPITNAIQSKKE